jgi:hypothetical protein
VPDDERLEQLQRLADDLRSVLFLRLLPHVLAVRRRSEARGAPFTDAAGKVLADDIDVGACLQGGPSRRLGLAAVSGLAISRSG